MLCPCMLILLHLGDIFIGQVDKAVGSCVVVLTCRPGLAPPYERILVIPEPSGNAVLHPTMELSFMRHGIFLMPNFLPTKE